METKSTTTNTLPRCVSFKEAADLLGVSTHRVQQLVKNGKLKAVKFSTRNSGVTETSLRAVLEGNTQRGL